MAQSRCGAVRILEAQMRPLIVAIPRFIQLSMSLLPLKPTGQLQRGVIRIGEVQQVRPLITAIPRFISKGVIS
jgi:hypothetical protein